MRSLGPSLLPQHDEAGQRNIRCGTSARMSGLGPGRCPLRFAPERLLSNALVALPRGLISATATAGTEGG